MQQANHFKIEQLPHYQPLDISHYQNKVLMQLEKNEATLSALLSHEGPFDWDNLMRPIEEMSDELNKLWAPFGHLHAVMENEDIRRVYNELIPLLTEYHTRISQNEKLYKALQQIAQSPAFDKLTPAQRKIIENDLRDFKLAGIHLPPAEKEQFALLQKDLSMAMTKFSENILDATQHYFLHFEDAASLAGLPAQALKLARDNAERRQLTGYVLTLDFPSYSTAIRYLDNRELRRELYTAYVSRASDAGPDAGRWDNAPIIQEILSLRSAMAKLLGFNHYAEYALQTKMAKSTNEVLSFLQDLLARSRPIAAAEHDELKSFAHDTDQIDELCAWDAPYYSEKLQQKKFHFSQEDVRPYFPISKVLPGFFTIMNKIYGITIREMEPEVATWHPSVKFLTIHDSAGQLRGGLYIDLYARAHKREGAWMDDAVARRLLKDNEVQLPIAYLTCNFMPPVNGNVALLTHDDVLTLFHEFGHCLHHLLTMVNYPAVGGINGVPWDAVEFPSQFLEFFCWEKQSLDLIAQHYQTGEPLPETLYRNMIAGKNFQTGIQMVRQLEFSLFDFRLHMEFDPAKTKQVQQLLDEVRTQTTFLPVPPFNRFQNSFSHIFAGGYAAGYYSYKWAEVLSADAYSKFEEHGIFNREVGVSFMENILEVGGVREPMDAFVAFRGRHPKLEPLLKYTGITEEQVDNSWN